MKKRKKIATKPKNHQVVFKKKNNKYLYLGCIIGVLVICLGIFLWKSYFSLYSGDYLIGNDISSEGIDGQGIDSEVVYENLYSEELEHITYITQLFGSYPHSMIRRFILPNFSPYNENQVFNGENFVYFGRGTPLQLVDGLLYSHHGDRFIPELEIFISNPEHYLRVQKIFVGEINRLRGEDNVQPLAILPPLVHAAIYHTRQKARVQLHTTQYWGNPRGTAFQRVIGFFPSNVSVYNFLVRSYDGWTHQFPDFNYEEDTMIWLAQTVYQNHPIFRHAAVYNTGVYMQLAGDGRVYITAKFTTDIFQNSTEQNAMILGTIDERANFQEESLKKRQEVGYLNHIFGSTDFFINYRFMTLSEFNR